MLFGVQLSGASSPRREWSINDLQRTPNDDCKHATSSLLDRAEIRPPLLLRYIENWIIRDCQGNQWVSAWARILHRHIEHHHRNVIYTSQNRSGRAWLSFSEIIALAFEIGSTLAAHKPMSSTRKHWECVWRKTKKVKLCKSPKIRDEWKNNLTQKVNERKLRHFTKSGALWLGGSEREKINTRWEVEKCRIEGSMHAVVQSEKGGDYRSNLNVRSCDGL